MNNVSFNYCSPYKKEYNLFNKKIFYSGALAPLSKDTVSFSGGAKLTGENMADAPTSRTCFDVYKNAAPAAFYLEKVLDKYLSPINKGKNPENEPITVSVRTKSPTSIREKTISKFGKIAREEKNAFCEAVIPEICKYATLNEGFTQQIAEVQAKILVNFLSKDAMIPPYKNEKLLLEKIVEHLESRNIINFNTKTVKQKEDILNTIADTLHTKSNAVHTDKNGAYILPSTVQGIKHYANDIIGARIILNDSSEKTVKEVINALKKAAEDNVINITSIENNIPNKSKLPKGAKISEYEYISPRKLRSLANTATAPYEEIPSKSGYLAIHINLDLSSDKLKTGKNKDVFNGYQGEIQIMDSCIEDFKEIEDLCYKLKDDKNAFQTKYKPFKNHFRKYYKETETKNAFNDYTYDLYLYQRKQSLTLSPEKRRSLSLPSVEEMGYSDVLPEQLDYNLLRSIKLECDETQRDNNIKAQNKKASSLMFLEDTPRKFKQLIYKLGLYN